VILDFDELEPGTEIATDLCIVGAGAAGIALARELAGGRLDVCVLESGGFEDDEATRELGRGEITGRPYQPLEETRMRAFGGSTNIWHGACTPLNALDFERRSWVPDSGWPITLQTLEPYYRRAQQVCSLGPYEYGEECWQRAGLEPPDLDPQKLVARFFRYSREPRFGTYYREELRRASNLRVFLHANATRLVPDAAGRRLDHVEVRSLQGGRGRVRARAFVLAAGGLENPRLLLDSAAREAPGLGNRNDLVGRYFMEHTYLQSGFLVPRSEEDARRLFLLMQSGSWTVGPGFRLAEPLQKQQRVLNSAIRLAEGTQLDSRAVVAALRIGAAIQQGTLPESFGTEAWTALGDIDDVFRAGYGAWRYDDWHHGEPRGLAVFAQTEQSPNPASRVHLLQERDALGMRRIALDWRLAELDRRSVRVMTERFAAEFARLDLGRVQLAEWIREEDGGWGENMGFGHHHCGTTRMAHSPASGVVNPDCRLHEVENLYLAGSSVFPTNGFANPTLTIVALALRLADHLGRTLG